MDFTNFGTFPAENIANLINFLTAVLAELREKQVIFENLSNDHSSLLFDIALKWVNVIFVGVQKLIKVCEEEPENTERIFRIRLAICDFYRGKYLQLASSAGYFLRFGFSLSAILHTYERWKKIDQSQDFNEFGRCRQKALRRYRSPLYHPLHVQFMENFYFQSHMANVRWYIFFETPEWEFDWSSDDFPMLINPPLNRNDNIEPPNCKDVDPPEIERQNQNQNQNTDTEESDEEGEDEEERRRGRGPEQEDSQSEASNDSLASIVFSEFEHDADRYRTLRLEQITDDFHIAFPKSISGCSTSTFPDDFVYTPMSREVFDEFEDLIDMEEKAIANLE